MSQTSTSGCFPTTNEFLLEEQAFLDRPAQRTAFEKFSAASISQRNNIGSSALFCFTAGAALLIACGIRGELTGNSQSLLLGPMIAFFAVGLELTLLTAVAHIIANNQILKYRGCLNDPATIEWAPGEYSDFSWNKFVEEEWGPEGRSVVKYGLKQLALLTGLGSSIFGFVCVFTFVITPVSEAIGIVPCLLIGLGAAVCVCGGTIGLLAITARYRKYKLSKDGPQFFRLTQKALVHNNILYDLVTPVCWCAGKPSIKILAMRIHRYGNKKSPCLEIALSDMRAVQILRQPLPQKEDSNLQDILLEFGLEEISPEEFQWESYLSGYALELEDVSAPTPNGY